MMHLTPAETEVARKFVAGLQLPPRLSFSEWSEEHYRLPVVSSAQPGRFHPWQYQRGVLDAMGDPEIERVTMMKSARIGYTKMLMAAIGCWSATAPTSIMLLVPTDDDARRFAVDEIEPMFQESPMLRGLIPQHRIEGRNTLTQKSVLGGGSIKIVSARAPRNLRSHDVKILLIDEADAMEVTAEGDPIQLAEKRTLAHPDRKIVVGSTPTIEGLSVVERLYQESDQRVFKVPCPHCSERFELQFELLQWPKGEPEKAQMQCPHCGVLIEERFKVQMVAGGEWEAQRPEVRGHAGFHISALYSLFANVSWARIAADYERARRAGPQDLQVFYNTILGRTWRQTVDDIDETGLMERAEPYGLRFDAERMVWVAEIPKEVLYITAGVDVQHDRLEVQFWGWGRSEGWVLGHEVIWGLTTQESTWDELDYMLATRWPHPLGGEIGIDAAAVDSGDGNRTQQVYNFCATREGRRIFAIKGVSGARPHLDWSRMKKWGIRLGLVGVDEVKADLMARLAMTERGPRYIHLPAHLDEEFYRQLTSEARRVRYVRGRPVYEWVRKPGRAAEALDCAVYANAIRLALRMNHDRREAQLAGESAPAAEKSFLKSLAKRLNG